MKLVTMKIKTAELKSHLCRYLARVRTTGETIVICDRDTPIATLGPVRQAADGEWAAFRSLPDRDAAGLGGLAKCAIPASQGKAQALGKFQVRRVIDRQRMC